MNILFWTDGFWPRIGGIETQGWHFVQSLAQKGHRCLVVAQKDEPKGRAEEVHHGISIQRFDFNSIVSKQRLSELQAVESGLELIWKEFQPDLIHLNTCIGWSAFVFSLFRRKFPIPVVLTVHAPYFLGGEVPALRDRICSMADRICCVSDWVLREMKRDALVSRDKISRIYNGLPAVRLAPTPLCFSPPTLLLVGRFTPEKGFDLAIRAFSLLKQRGSPARLLLVGGGSMESYLQQLAFKEGLDGSVEFVGAVPQEEIPAWINRASLLLMPSYFESFGLAAVEAMQMQRPVIASRVGGLPEIIVEGQTGLLVPEKDPEALFDAIQSLLAAPEKAVQMGEEGRRRALAHFSLAQNVAAYEEIYRKL